MNRIALDDETIVNSAARLFTERGYDGTSMQDLADDLGYTKAAIYHHIGSKVELLVRIHDEFIDAMFELVEQSEILEGDSDPKRELREYVAITFATVRRYRNHVKVFHQEISSLDGADLVRIRGKRQKYERFLKDTIQRGMETGSFQTNVPAKIAALFFFGACNWTYQWYREDGQFSAEELSDFFTSLLMFGFTGPGVAAEGEQVPRGVSFEAQDQGALQ